MFPANALRALRRGAYERGFNFSLPRLSVYESELTGGPPWCLPSRPRYPGTALFFLLFPNARRFHRSQGRKAASAAPGRAPPLRGTPGHTTRPAPRCQPPSGRRPRSAGPAPRNARRAPELTEQAGILYSKSLFVHCFLAYFSKSLIYQTHFFLLQ